jgi:Uri superfamily endonuclease
VCFARVKRIEYIDEILEGIGASDADCESHFLHAFLEMLLHMHKMRQVRQAIREKILSEFGVREN